MGGDCGASSEYGKGSRFWFRLPLQRDLIAAPVQHTQLMRALPLAPLLQSQRRVLLVEDNLVNQEVATALLELLGCDSTVAQNGREAVAALTTPHAFDLVLMDCQMPEMDGFEATHRVREYEQAHGLHTPIIALTANAMSGDREMCLASGMDDFLSKPFQLQDLHKLVDSWCPQLLEPAPGQAREIAP
jgi:CheY-like chemotaxis protein